MSSSSSYPRLQKAQNKSTEVCKPARWERWRRERSFRRMPLRRVVGNVNSVHTIHAVKFGNRGRTRAPRRLGVAHHLPRRLLGESLDAVLPTAVALHVLRERVRADQLVGIVRVAARDVLELGDIVGISTIVHLLDGFEQPGQRVLPRLGDVIEAEVLPQRIPRANGLDERPRGSGVGHRRPWCPLRPLGRQAAIPVGAYHHRAG